MSPYVVTYNSERKTTQKFWYRLSTSKITPAGWVFDPWYCVEINTEKTNFESLNSLFIMGWRQNYYYYNWDTINFHLFNLLRGVFHLVQNNFFALFFDQRLNVQKKINQLLRYYKYPTQFPTFVPGTLTNRRVAFLKKKISTIPVITWPIKSFVIVFDGVHNTALLKESRVLNIPTICLSGSKCYADYIIPCVEKAQFSTLYFFFHIFLQIINEYCPQKKLPISALEYLKPPKRNIRLLWQKLKIRLSITRKPVSLIRRWKAKPRKRF